MCLYVNSKARVKTLKRSRLGWKIVRRDDDDIFWYSPIQNDNYIQYGKITTARKWECYQGSPIRKDIEDIVIKESFNHRTQKVEYTVNEGYHSYRALWWALIIWDWKYECLRPLRPCIIPKGTRYVNGHYFERASKEIIVFRTLKDALRILFEKYIK